MKKIFALFVMTLLCWGFVAAQVPDNPPVVCELPSVLDSLLGETPECPTFGVVTVSQDGTSGRIDFAVPVVGGASFDGVQGHFAVTVDGVAGNFLVEGTFNANHTLLTGSVLVVGDNALSGMDLRGHTLYVTAALTGCHAAGAADPTSSEGIVSQAATYAILPACTSFDSVVAYASGGQYQLRAYIDLTALQTQNPSFNIVATAGQYTGGTAWYVDASHQFIATPMTALPTQTTILQASASVDARCGVTTVNNGYVTISSATVSVTVPMAIPCPTLGNVSVVSNLATNPTLRADTLFVQVGNYNADMIHRVVFDVTRIGSSTTLEWVADGWSVAHGAAYKVLTLAMLQQLGLSTTDIVATVDVTLEVNANYSGCTNVSVSGKVITLTALPECPAFAGYASTMVTKDYDGNITVSTPVQYYNPAMIHHTGVAGQDSLYYTLYVNTSNTAQQGNEAGTVDAVYDPQSQMMTCTIPYVQVTPGARYDFLPHINLTGYCNSASDAYITIDGPSGSIISDIFCPICGDTTIAVRNPDGSVTVTHQLVNYNPNLLFPSLSPRFYAYDTTGVERTLPSSAFEISSTGLMSCTFPDSCFAPYPSHNMKFRPRIFRVQACGQISLYGPNSNGICIPYSGLPSFSYVNNTQGGENAKTSLFKNEGIILKAKVANPSGADYLSRIAKAGFLISRSPITAYSAEKAVFVPLSGVTGDSVVYKVGIDSCGGTTYYRPFVVMKGCDSAVVLGTQKSFTMWAPALTVSANPTSVAYGGSVTLNAAATMHVGQWDQNTSNGIPCQGIVDFINYCNIVYTEDCSTTKNMEDWMKLLVGLRNCSMWNSISSQITNNFGMDPGNAEFHYRWERNGTEFFSSATSMDNGVTTDSPSTTTTYTGIADFSYNDVHCIQKQNVTVTVP
jgi:hypothetical protein